MSAADRLEDGFPHGTVEGFTAGCKGGWCPEGNDHGLSCKKAKQLHAGDYRYQRLVKRGLTPGQIADELGLSPETHQPPKRKSVLEDDTDDVVDVEPEEEPIMATKAPETPTAAPPKQKAAVETTAEYEKRRRAETRAWAAEHGVHIGTRGRIPQIVVDAFAKNDPNLLPGAHAETPVETVENPPTHDEAPETGLPASEAHTVGEHPSNLDGAGALPDEGAEPSNAAEFAAMWNALSTEGRDEIVLSIRTAIDASLRCYTNHHVPSIEDRLLAYTRDLQQTLARVVTAESALELTLQKWDTADRELQAERVVTRVLHAALDTHSRLLESASALAEVTESILDGYAAEIRRNHDEIARLRAENEQLRHPWWKRASS